MKKNIIVGQSGGPTAVINASLYGVITEAKKHYDTIDTIYGMLNGIEGFLEDRLYNLSSLSSNELECIHTTPGSYLGSCRYKLPEDLDNPIYSQIFSKFEQQNIGYFFYIGGNDSMDTVSKLSSYATQIQSSIRIIGIPKTIDNDLIETDHTPGFGSAAKYVATSVREIGIDASVYDNHPSVTIVEIMGRHAGWLTASSALARKFTGDNPRLIYLPEIAFSPEHFIDKVQTELKKTPNLVICISEGIHDEKGTFICEYSGTTAMDNFGHKMLTGAGKYLESLIKEKLKIKARSIELNVTQRCSSISLSKTDLDEATLSGSFGVISALKGFSGQMVSLQRSTSKEYHIDYVLKDASLICNKEKCVPSSWITDDGSDITEEFIQYLTPLIQGEITLPMKYGIPCFAYRTHHR